MAAKTSPLSFEIETDLIERITRFKENSGSSSVSAIIRKALEEYDLEEVGLAAKETKQVSIRLPKELRDQLKIVSKNKSVSVGNIVRDAILSFLDDVELEKRKPIIDRPQRHESLPRSKDLTDDLGNPWQI